MSRLAKPGILILLALLMLSACSTGKASTSATATTNASVHFDKASCPFTLGAGMVEGSTVTCGNLNVPEDRANPKSPMIKVAVAIFDGTDNKSASAPVIRLEGGPGGGAIGTLAELITASNRSLIVGKRDLILVDQRGTGKSQPSLQCSELVTLSYTDLDKDIPNDQALTRQNQALTDCRARLVKAGVNLDAYTTYEAAADINDLITVLGKSRGFTQANLYGVSYGTKLALETMRSFSNNLRSVVLDSTVPPQRNVFTSVPASAARAFGVLFSACAADAQCNAKYPDLQNVFYGLITSLNATPATFTADDSFYTKKNYNILLKGDGLIGLLFSSLYDTSAIPDIPKMLYQVKAGDYTHLLADFYGRYEFTGDSISYGLYYSVRCSEEATFVTPDDIIAAGQSAPTQIRDAEVQSLQEDYSACKVWNVKKSPQATQDAVSSDVPTLILEGEFDPITPPANGDQAAKTLSHSYQQFFKGTGHGVEYTSACSISLIQSFFAVPTNAPDGSCSATTSEPAWT